MKWNNNNNQVYAAAVLISGSWLVGKAPINFLERQPRLYYTIVSIVTARSACCDYGTQPGSKLENPISIKRAWLAEAMLIHAPWPRSRRAFTETRLGASERPTRLPVHCPRVRTNLLLTPETVNSFQYSFPFDFICLSRFFQSTPTQSSFTVINKFSAIYKYICKYKRRYLYIWYPKDQACGEETTRGRSLERNQARNVCPVKSSQKSTV